MLAPSGRRLAEHLARARVALPAEWEATGPHGAPGGGRWVVADDVMRAAVRQAAPYRRDAEWQRGEDADVEGPPQLVARRGAALWPEQMAAVVASVPEPGAFRSGVHDMDFGRARPSWASCALQAPGVVVTQHKISVDQWAAHLVEAVGCAT